MSAAMIQKSISDAIVAQIRKAAERTDLTISEQAVAVEHDTEKNRTTITIKDMTGINEDTLARKICEISGFKGKASFADSPNGKVITINDMRLGDVRDAIINDRSLLPGIIAARVVVQPAIVQAQASSRPKA